MNGVHDMGGLQCYGPIRDGTIQDEDELKFHHDWERQVLALALATGATGTWNLDQSRSARETLPPTVYLSSSYYSIWLQALEKLLIQNQLATADELRQGKSLYPPATLKRVLQADEVSTALAAGSPVERSVSTTPDFAVGDRVRVRNQHKSTHTRLPGYIRNRCGVVCRIHGAHVFPDSHAQGLGEDPQWLYNVCFDSNELWGEERSHPGQVCVDCWEPYLELENNATR